MNVFEEMLYIEEEVQVERNYQRLIKEEQENVLNEGFVENAGIRLKLNVFRNEIANFVVDYDKSVGKDSIIAKKLNLSMQAKRLATVELASRYFAKVLKNPLVKQQHDKMSDKVLISRTYGNTTITYVVNIHAYMQKYSESNCKALRNQIYKKLMQLSDKDKYAKLGGSAESIQPKKEKKFRKIYEKLASKGSMAEETDILDEGLFNKQAISLNDALPTIKENLKKFKDMKHYKFVNAEYIKNSEPDTYNYYNKKGFITKIDGFTCFIKGTKEDIKGVNIYAITNSDVLCPLKVKFK